MRLGYVECPVLAQRVHVANNDMGPSVQNMDHPRLVAARRIHDIDSRHGRGSYAFDLEVWQAPPHFLKHRFLVVFSTSQSPNPESTT